MKRVKRNGIDWLLQDEELVALIKELVVGKRLRRTHEYLKPETASKSS